MNHDAPQSPHTPLSFRRTGACVALVGCVILASSSALSGQTSFDAASIREGTSFQGRPDFYIFEGGGLGTVTPGQLRATGVPLMQLILRAYTVKPFQVVSSRSLETDRYDIVAKVPFGATVQQVNVMLRNLLEERIGLVVHYEARGGPVYEMVIGKRGLKMNPAAPATPSATPPSEATVPTNLAPGMFIGNDDKYELAPGYPNIIVDAVDASTTRVTARMQGVPELIRMIERQTGRTVRDRTGLKGRYDFTFTFTHRAQGASSLSTPPPSDAASDPSSDFLAALESELGLKLVSKRGPVDILVVDSWSKVPVNR